MNIISKWTVALVLLSGTTYGQQPPDVVVSDANQNTAMGTNALISNTPDCGPAPPPCNSGNTAAGYNALYSNRGGGYNTALGVDALYSNTSMTGPGTFLVASGYENTAIGAKALYSNLVGSLNTAVGFGALYSNTTSANIQQLVSGNSNTASGVYALYSNTTGSNNTASGVYALYSNTTGNNNSASGANALYSDTTGSNNTASGFNALYANTTGSQNTASGVYALQENTIGISNTANGFNALNTNTSGNNNTADGVGALQRNTTGYNNTAIGLGALDYNTTGNVNVGLGYAAGSKVTTGSHNIEIGNVGAASDNNTIKIGVEGQQAKTFIAGIYNTSVTGSAVMVNSAGQLGVVVSSERFKTAIAPMSTDTAKLDQLRPVTFRLKTDAKGTRQYGLIAEEVAKVYPELVIRDSKGRIDGVRYDELAPMLLNEMQQEHATIAAQAVEIRNLKKQLAGIQAALVKLQPKDELVAQR